MNITAEPFDCIYYRPTNPDDAGGLTLNHDRTVDMVPVSELTKRELDFWVSLVIGIRFFIEERGEYELMVWTRPGAPTPWERIRNADPSRWRETQYFSETKRGFYGDPFPKFSVDWLTGGPLIQTLKANLTANTNEGALTKWTASKENSPIIASGDTPLVAVCRLLVMSNVGPKVPRL